MLAYILRRLLLIVPTLFGIMVLNFFIVQAAPGGPVEQMIARIEGTAVGATERFSGSASGGELMQRPQQGEGGGAYRGARGLPKELVQRIERMYGFDKPVGERFLQMMKSYLVFDFGESFFRNRRVVDLVLDNSGDKPRIDRKVSAAGDLDEAAIARLRDVVERTPVTLALKSGFGIDTVLDKR